MDPLRIEDTPGPTFVLSDGVRLMPEESDDICQFKLLEPGTAEFVTVPVKFRLPPARKRLLPPKTAKLVPKMAGVAPVGGGGGGGGGGGVTNSPKR